MLACRRFDVWQAGKTAVRKADYQRIIVHLTTAQLDTIDEIAQAEGAARSTYVRRIVAEHLKQIAPRLVSSHTLVMEGRDHA